MNKQHELGAVVAILVSLVCLGIAIHSILKGVIRYAFRNVKKPVRNKMDSTLVQLNHFDAVTVRDLLNGGAAIFGRTGSGKTSSSGRTFGRAVVRIPESGGLILVPKPEDVLMWQDIFSQEGRADALRIFSPYTGTRFNALNYVRTSLGGHPREITKFLTVIGETLRSNDTDGKEDGDFWEKEAARMIHNAVVILLLAKNTLTANDLHLFLAGHAQSPADLATGWFLKSFHREMLVAADAAEKPAHAAQDYRIAREYFLAEIPAMNDRTRTSISVHVFGTLHVLNTGLVNDLLGTETNISPDDMFRGCWILVNMPPSNFGDEGLLVAGALKYLAQKAILKREATDASNVVVIWQDEAHLFTQSYDAPYLAQCRSRKGCLVSLTQGLSSYYSAMGRASEHKVKSLLTNFSLKVFHALGSPDDAEYASSLIGRDKQLFFGGSTGGETSFHDELTGRTSFQGSFSQHMEQLVQPAVFMNGLRTGGKENKFECDAIVIKSGEGWVSGANWLPVTFTQK